MDTIFPFKCVNCHKIIPAREGCICKKCLNLISIKKGFECIGCGLVSSLGKTCNKCASEYFIDHLFITALYREPLVSLLKTFKYRFVELAGIPLAYLMRKHLVWLNDRGFNIIAENAVICPVPLHYKRLNWRGFNQSEIIAKSLADWLRCDMRTDLLTRSPSRPQADLKDRTERTINLRHIFKISETAGKEVLNKTIILIDDVCTTGTTMNECAKILKENGARKVIGYVIARG